MAMSLADALAAKKAKLKETVIHIRMSDGKLYEERKNASGKLEKVATGVAVLPAFQTNAANGFSALSAHSYDAKSKKWTKSATITATAPPNATATAAAPAMLPIATDACDAKSKPAASATAAGAASHASILSPYPALPASLSVISYNVWFADTYWTERAKALFAIVAHHAPDVVCLQEVTPRFLQLLCENEYFQSQYVMSDSTGGNTVTPYGVLIALKRATLLTPGVVPEFTIHSLPSNMARRLVRVIIKFHTPAAIGSSVCRLVIGTAHLESLDNEQLRTEQIKSVIVPALNDGAEPPKPTPGGSASAATAVLAMDGGAAVVFMGDTNYGDGELTPIAAWNESSKTSGYTYGDVQLLVNATDRSETGPSMGRIDKVMIRQPLGTGSAPTVTHAVTPAVTAKWAYRPVSITKIGTEAIDVGPNAPKGRIIRPSDHFGLHAAFKLETAAPATAAAAVKK